MLNVRTRERKLLRKWLMLWLNVKFKLRWNVTHYAENVGAH